jgi:hypothetical protein
VRKGVAGKVHSNAESVSALHVLLKYPVHALSIDDRNEFVETLNLLACEAAND